MPPSSSLPLRAMTSRSIHTSAPLSTPNKDHHVIPYPADAFPKGYAAASTHCGIKKAAGALDLGILVSTTGSTSAAACLTRNAFKAAPVTVTADLLQTSGGRARGLVMNSGNANAVTGKLGLENAWKMSKGVTSRLDAGEGGTLVLSTGVIGQHVPIDKIEKALPGLVDGLGSTPDAWSSLARAFMTTDTFPKLRTRQFTLSGKQVRMAGIDKGAGMISPSMGPPQPPHATLLGVIATDAAVEPKSLQKALQYAVDRSFNSITVDGDMSTNDSIIALANGASGAEVHEGSEEFNVFRDELKGLAEELAQLVVRDGEGATKFVTVRVKGAASEDIATKVARTIASSPLVKTAMYGEDANWGRILCAVGYSPQAESLVDPTAVSVTFHPPSSSSNSTPFRVLTNGEPEPNIDEVRAKEVLSAEDIEIVVDLGQGQAEGRVWTCDFSHDYVTINGSYRS